MDEKLQELQAQLDAFKSSQEQLNSLESKNAEQVAEIKSLTDTINSLSAQIDELKAQKLNSNQSMKPLELKTQVANLFNSEEFNADRMAKAFKGGVGREYELKADVDTGDVNAPVLTDEFIAPFAFPRTRKPQIMPLFRQGRVSQGKHRIVYVDGTYTSNAGYVGEGAAAANADLATATEHARALAKISAKLKVTEEMFEDADFLASQLENQMMSKGLLFADNELISGNGHDTNYPNHIYGLQNAATAFAAAKAGCANAFVDANIKDLIEAIQLQGRLIDASGTSYVNHGGFNIDTVIMNPIDVAKYRHVKDANGNYIIYKLPDGQDMINGCKVIECPKIASNSLIALEAGLPELYWKRNAEVKIAQEADDFSKDQYTICLFLRCQALVRDNDKLGVIYVSSISSAITAITDGTASGRTLNIASATVTAQTVTTSNVTTENTTTQNVTNQYAPQNEE